MPRGDRPKNSFAHGKGLFCEQPALLVSSEEALGLDHPARELWKAIEQTVAPRLRELAQDKGRAPHDPARMFAVWIYGTLDGFPSNRELEERCRYDVRYQFLSGGTSPDHCTLSRWFKRFNPILDELFKEVLGAIKTRTTLRYQLVAIDGTRLKGARTQWLKSPIDSEPEASTIKTRNGFVVGYNAQAAVDAGSGVVVGCLVSNSPNDMNLMDSVLGTLSQTPEVVVADAGYDTYANLDALDQRGIYAVVNPDSRPNQFFSLDDAGVLRCPVGKVPELKYRRRKNGDKLYDIHLVSCRGCVLKEGCNKERKTARISSPTGIDPVLRVLNRKRASSAEGRALLKARGPTVERFFALAKFHRKFSRFHRRGLAGARLEWMLVCISHNLGLLSRLFWLFLGCLGEISRVRSRGFVTG
jgi:transposase